MSRRIFKLTLTGGLTAVVVAASFVTALLLRPQASKAAVNITSFTLGNTLGGVSSSAGAINNLGHIIGSADTADGVQHAIFWDGVMHELSPTSDTSMYASDINDSDQIVGVSNGLPVEWNTPASDPTPLLLPPTLTTSFNPTAINNQGQIAGTGSDPNTGIRLPITLIGSQAYALPLPAPTVGCDADRLNNQGEVIGVCDDGKTYAWLTYTSPPIQLLPLAPGGGYGATSINDLGHIVGIAAASTGEGHAVMWLDPTLPPKDLGTLVPPGTICSDCAMATAVNNNDLAVGIAAALASSPVPGGAELFAWGAITPLGSPANCPGFGWPQDINDAGQAIGGMTSCGLAIVWSITGTPSTPQSQIQALSAQVQGLVSGGTLTSGEGNALQVKLDAALSSLSQGSPTGTAASATQSSGNVTAACNQLQAFVNQVQAYVKSGRLTAAQGQSLTSAAGALTANLCK